MYKTHRSSEHENIVIGIDTTVRRFAHKLCQVSGFLPDEAYAWNVELFCLYQWRQCVINSLPDLTTNLTHGWNECVVLGRCMWQVYVVLDMCMWWCCVSGASVCGLLTSSLLLYWVAMILIIHSLARKLLDRLVCVLGGSRDTTECANLVLGGDVRKVWSVFLLP